jgi:hypothetical protein
MIDRTKLDSLAATTWFRAVVAAALVAAHLAAFTLAAHDRLDRPFNAAPGSAPRYSDLGAPALGPLPRQPHDWSRLVVSRWDAQHFIGMAVRGLAACPTVEATGVAYAQCGLVWYPAFGKAGGVLGGTFGIPADFALLALALVAAFVLNMLWTSGPIVKRLGRLEAHAALLAFNVFPTAFYLVTPHPDGAMLAFGLGGFGCLADRRWFTAAALIGTSTLFGVTGLTFATAFACTALVAVLRGRNDASAPWWHPLAAIPLALWGLLLHFVMLEIFLGDAFAQAGAQAAFAASQKVGGYDLFRLVDPEVYVRGGTVQNVDTALLVSALAICALAGRETVKRFGSDAGLFLIVTAALLAFGPLALDRAVYWGLSRHLLLVPLTFLAAGVIARKHPWVFALWIVTCASVYWHVELCSYITQGDAAACPCLGKIEYTMPY